MSDGDLVVITGVTGYLGAATLLEFLKCASPKLKIRCTVRDVTNEQKMNQLKAGLGELFEQVEFVNADLMNATSLDAAIEGCTYVVHTASPFHFGGDCVEPAVKGSMAVMMACAKHGVKRCVMTSSGVAVMALSGKEKEARGYSTPYDETCWSNPNRPEGMGEHNSIRILTRPVGQIRINP